MGFVRFVRMVLVLCGLSEQSGRAFVRLVRAVELLSGLSEWYRFCPVCKNGIGFVWLVRAER